MYQNLLILDTETTGLDPEKHHTIEVGAVLWNAEWGMVQCWSAVIQSEEVGPEWVHGISEGLAGIGVPRDQVYYGLTRLTQAADAIIAHNADFDRKMLPDLEKPWIDSMDIEWPKKSNSRSLAGIALAHGVPVVSAHRALTDCLTLTRLLDRAKELGMDVQEALTKAARPKVLIQACVSFAQNQLAKDEGFRWDRGNKRWAKKMPLEEAQNANWAFEWTVVE